MSSLRQKKLLCAVLLLDEEIDYMLGMENSVKRCSNRNKTDKLFINRNSEEAYRITVERRLFGNEVKFREYFRVSTEIFEQILNSIRHDIRRSAYNRHKQPVTEEEKLCITLR